MYSNSIIINLSQIEEYYGEYVFGEKNGDVLYKNIKNGNKPILIPIFVPKNVTLNVAIINDTYNYPLKSCNVTNKYHSLKISDKYSAQDKYYYNFTSLVVSNKSVVDVLRLKCDLTLEELINIKIQIKLH